MPAQLVNKTELTKFTYRIGYDEKTIQQHSIWIMSVSKNTICPCYTYAQNSSFLSPVKALICSGCNEASVPIAITQEAAVCWVACTFTHPDDKHTVNKNKKV